MKNIESLVGNETPNILQPSLPEEPIANAYPLYRIYNQVREGQIRIPHFQRGLRWDANDAVLLIDSILRGYPIGSLLLWQRPAPEEQVILGGWKFDAPAMDAAKYVVDGQQRITSLLNALSPETGMEGDFALVYDLKQEPFRVRRRSRNESQSIALPDLFDLTRLLRWTRENQEYLEHVDKIDKATSRLREFAIPTYEVRSSEPTALREIYDRMNSTGKRLTRAEAFWGLFAPDEGPSNKNLSLTEIQNHIDTVLKWGWIDDNTLLKIFLARRSPDITRDVRIEFDDIRRPSTNFPGESLQEAHEHTLEALVRTVDFLRNEVGVPHFALLTYRFILVSMSRFFAHHPTPSPRNRELLARWYWRASVIGPNISKGSATGAARALSTCVTPESEDSSIENLMNFVDKKESSFEENWPDVYNFRTNQASSQVMVCALWDKGPISPYTGEKFSRDELSHAIGQNSTPNVVCPDLFSKNRIDANNANSLGNRILAPGVPSDLVNEFAEESTSVLPCPDLFGINGSTTGASSRQEIFDSHLIPHGDSDMESLDDFVSRRNQLVQECVDNFLNRRLGLHYEQTPDLNHFNMDDDNDKN